MGDAAQGHGPAGGKGTNTCLVDAVMLGLIFAEVAEGRPEESLDDYAPMRRAAALEESSRPRGSLTHLAVTRSAPQRAIRGAIFRIVAAARARRRVAMDLSGLARRHFAEVAPAAAARIATVAAMAA